jgi:hypothetical protein
MSTVMPWRRISVISSNVASTIVGDEPQRRLVEHEQLRTGHERPRDGEHLLLAARQRPAELLGALAQDGEALEHALEVLGVRAARPRTKAPISRFSRTVISGKIRRPSGQCAMPARRISWAGRPSMRASRKVTGPRGAAGARRWSSAVVVLPAPLAPSRHTSSPAATRRLTPCSTSTLP